MFKGKKVMIRSDRAGVFFGVLRKQLKGGKVILEDCYRVWYWDGAASISQLANTGSSKRANCKICPSVKLARIETVIETLIMTDTAYKNLSEGVLWTV